MPNLPDELALAQASVSQAQQLHAQHNYIAARPLYEQALIIFSQQLGPTHEDTLACLSALAGILADSSSLAPLAPHEAYMQQGTTWQSTAGSLASYSPEMLKSMDYFQCHVALTSGYDPADAEAHLQRIVQRIIAEQSAEPLSPHAQRALDLAQQHEREADDAFNRGDVEQASEGLQQALALREQVHGADAMEHVPLLRKLIAVAQAQNDPEEAIALLQRIADIHVRLLGDSHAATIQVLSEVTFAQWNTQGFGNASTQNQLLDAMDSASGGMMGGMLKKLFGALGGLGSTQRPQQPAKRREKAPKKQPGLPPILADLHRVKWAELRHAEGPADDLPALLLRLLDDDADARQEAGDRLAELLSYDDTMYPATAAVVPFLWRMLAMTNTPDRGKVIGYLATLAQVTQPPHTTDAERDTRAALLVGVDLLLQLCREAQELHGPAAYMLALLSEKRSEIGPRLKAIVADERDEFTLASMLVSLADLLERDEQALGFFLSQMRSATHEALRFAAAAAVIDRSGPQAPDDAVKAISQTLAAICAQAKPLPTQAELDERFSQGNPFDMLFTVTQELFAEQKSYWVEAEERLLGTFWSGDGIASATAALAKLGPQRGIPLIAAALPRLPDGEDATYTLLTLAFGDGKVRRAGLSGSLQQDGCPDWDGMEKLPWVEHSKHAKHDLRHLTTEQRAVLQALLDYERGWSGELEHHPLIYFGLPAHRRLLQHLVDATPSASAPLRIPEAISAPPPFTDVLFADAPARRQRIQQAFERHPFLKWLLPKASDYLDGRADLLAVWEGNSHTYSLGYFDDGVASLLSTGDTLDLLDLRLLDLLAMFGSAPQFIEAIAHQERVAQAFARLQQLQKQHGSLQGFSHPVSALALARTALVTDERPTPLGWLLLIDTPTRISEALTTRNQTWNPKRSNSADLIDLLLIHQPPYIDEALQVLRENALQLPSWA